MERKILVIGGTGMLAIPVCEIFKKNKWEVHAVSRSMEKAEYVNKKFDCYTKIHETSIGEKSFLELVKEFEFVHLNLSGDEDKIIKKLLEVLEETKKKYNHKIQRISYISGASTNEESAAASTVIAMKWRSEKMIKNSGFDYTIFKPGWFYEVLPQFVRNGKGSLIGKQPIKRDFIGANDFAKLIFTAYDSKLEESKNQCFEIICDDCKLTLGDAIKMYLKKIDPKSKPVVKHAPIWMMKTLAFLTRNKGLSYFVTLMKYVETAITPIENSNTKKILGNCPTTLEDWLKNKSYNNEYHYGKLFVPNAKKKKKNQKKKFGFLKKVAVFTIVSVGFSMIWRNYNKEILNFFSKSV